MGLGKVIGLGIAFVFLLSMVIYTFVYDAVAIATGSNYVLPLSGGVFWAIITYFVGRKFIKAFRQYRASRVGKPLR